MYQNFPNPFNSTTKVRLNVIEYSAIEIIVFDLFGHEVKKIISEKMNPGMYEFDFDSGTISTGVYFLRMISNNFVETIKIFILK